MYGLTQAALADDLGFSGQSSVSQYLKGKIPLNVDAALKFAQRFKCSVSDFSPSIQGEIDRIAEFASKNASLTVQHIPNETRRRYEAQTPIERQLLDRFRAADTDKQHAVLTLLPTVQDIGRRAG